MTKATPVPETVTLHVPFRMVKRSGRKEMQLPADAFQLRKANSTLIKALARAFRWRRMLESGEVGTIADLAERENIAPSYLTRIIRLTFLAPDIVETVLDGGQLVSITAEVLRAGFDDDWGSQRLSLAKFDAPGEEVRQ